MNTILRPVLELTVMIPGLLLAYLPVQTYLKQAAWQAGCMACTSSGRESVSWKEDFAYFLNVPTSSVLFPTLLVLMLIYHKSSEYLYLEIRQHFSGNMCSLCLRKQPFQSSECHCGRKTWTSGNRTLVPHQCRNFLQCNMSAVRC